MAAKTDLTFAELLAELPADSIAYGSGDIVISLAAVTGDTFTSINNDGVCEALYKLRKAAGDAQVTANDAIEDVDEQLTSFPTQTTGAFDAETLTVPITQVQQVLLNVDPNAVTGTNA